jgi:hypothetical protein
MTRLVVVVVRWVVVGVVGISVVVVSGEVGAIVVVVVTIGASLNIDFCLYKKEIFSKACNIPNKKFKISALNGI